MYSIDKIKDALLCHKNKDLYKLTIDNILNLLQIARSTYYEWIKNYRLTGDDNNFLSERVANTIRSSRKLTQECEAFIINYVIKNPSFNIVLSGYEVPILMLSIIYYNYINYDENYLVSRRQSH
jgi:hypothetical protein